MTQIELRGVRRVYSPPGAPEVHALQGIDLEIASGEFVAIVGPSGGGKTTLMNVLGLLDDPTDGEYLLDGEPVRASNNRAAAELRSRKIGFIFQAFHLLESRPSLHSVELSLLYQGVPRASRLGRARAALDLVGLGERAEQSTSSLSGGQRQRVAIARAVAGGAKLILADEPTGNLDSENAARVLDELERLNESGATIVVVTHSQEVAARADRVIHIADGHVINDERREFRPATPHVPSDAPVASSAPANEYARSSRPRRIRFIDMLRDSLASVFSRRYQTLGQSVAVAIAVALTVTTIGLSSSASSQVSATFDAHLNREVSARWSTGLPHSPSLESVPSAVEDLSGVDSAAIFLDMPPGKVSTFAESRQVRPHIALGDVVAAARLGIVEASWHQGPLTSGQALVGDLLAKQLDLTSPDFAPAISINGRSYVVVGLIKDSSRLPLLRGEVIIGPPADTGTLERTDANLLVVTTAGAAQQVAAQLPGAINPFQPDRVFVTAPTDSATLRGQVEQGVQAALIAFTLLSLIVAIAALMNATLLAVHARRAEIGMRKALGARDRHIGALITIESTYVGLFGGVTGLLLGMIAVLAVTISQHWAPVFDIRLMPVAILVGLAVGAGGGGFAAARAARLRPADNLRA